MADTLTTTASTSFFRLRPTKGVRLKKPTNGIALATRPEREINFRARNYPDGRISRFRRKSILPEKKYFSIIPVFTDEEANKTPKTLPVKRSRALFACESAPVRYFSLSLDQRRRRASRRIAPRNATLGTTNFAPKRILARNFVGHLTRTILSESQQ